MLWRTTRFLVASKNLSGEESFLVRMAKSPIGLGPGLKKNVRPFWLFCGRV